ncbi:hypothetical protein M758_UG155500 [Ceratodon purpureus]|nr:hypothetical protein M758_UG155500 [Ceratodon purpureus]
MKWRRSRRKAGGSWSRELLVMKAAGVVEAPADQIFNLIMDYGPERQQWDHMLELATVIEVIDGHSDVLYIRLRQDHGYMDTCQICSSKRSLFSSLLLTRYRLEPKEPQSCHVLAKVNRKDRGFKGTATTFLVEVCMPHGNSRLQNAKKHLLIRSKWHLTKVMNMVSQIQEFQALSAVGAFLFCKLFWVQVKLKQS